MARLNYQETHYNLNLNESKAPEVSTATRFETTASRPTSINLFVLTHKTLSCHSPS